MKKEIRDYLQNKEYNLLFERLLMLLKPHPGARSKVDLMDSAERDTLYGNNAMSRVYNFSNEYLDRIFKGMDLTGKRAFVVGSSGDQALHCIQNGASEVTLVDGNMWTKPYVELKLAAIKNLEFEEFSSYMTYDQIFNHKFYSKVSHDLSPESQAFWDEIIMQFSGQSLEDISLAMNVKDEIFQHCSIYFNPDIGRKDNNYYVNKA